MKKRQRGFTLLELLIGMVLLSLMLTLLFGALRLGARSWDSGDKRAEEIAQMRSVHGFLRRELGQVFLLRWKKDNDSRLAFDGGPDALKFVAPLAGQVGGGGLYLMGLTLEQGEAGKRLILKRAVNPEAKDFSSLEQGDSTVLAEHLEKLGIAYFGALSPEGKAGWQDKWDDARRLPQLLRLQIKTSDGRDWPDLVVPLVVDKGCTIWDPIHRRCIS